MAPNSREPCPRERLEKRFSSTRYIFSKAGIPKILSVVLFLVAGILFLVEDHHWRGATCSGDGVHHTGDSPDWYPWLFPMAAVTTASLSAFVYAAFVTGCAKKALKIWVHLDITSSICLSIANLIISIMVITQFCLAVETADRVPGPLGLVGTALLIFSTAATYYMWRHGAEEQTTTTLTRRRTVDTRGSIFAFETEKDAFGV